MSVKESNEITVKLKCELNEIYNILEDKGFEVTDEFSLDDTYFIPIDLDIDSMTTRDILSKAILIRDIRRKPRLDKFITFKTKEFDEQGNILKQRAINCHILDIEEAKNLLVAIGYRQIMYIEEYDFVYEKDGFKLAIKDIKDGDNLIEVETKENNAEIEVLEQKINELGIPIYTDSYFVKKAEIELEKVLGR